MWNILKSILNKWKKIRPKFDKVKISFKYQWLKPNIKQMSNIKKKVN